MKYLILQLLIAFCLIISCNTNGCSIEEKLINDSLRNELMIYKNTISILKDSINTINVIQNNINIYKDSIININHELIITKLKLERIREYNKIAANGNNIKFLRGWINRTLND